MRLLSVANGDVWRLRVWHTHTQIAATADSETDFTAYWCSSSLLKTQLAEYSLSTCFHRSVNSVKMNCFYRWVTRQNYLIPEFYFPQCKDNVNSANTVNTSAAVGCCQSSRECHCFQIMFSSRSYLHNLNHPSLVLEIQTYRPGNTNASVCDSNEKDFEILFVAVYFSERKVLESGQSSQHFLWMVEISSFHNNCENSFLYYAWSISRY